MKNTFKRSISFLLVLLMLLGFFPGLGGFIGAAEAAGNIANAFTGQDADVFSALGFDTSVLPEGFDPETTDNPYGRERLPGKQVFEILRADNSGYRTFGVNNNALGLGELGHDSSTGAAMPKYDGKTVDLFASAVGDFNGDGFAAEVAYVGVAGLADGKGGSEIPLVMFVFDTRTGAYSDVKKLGDISPINTVSPGEAEAVKIDQYENEERWQNLLQIETGDFDGDGYSEIAVYVAEGGKARVDIYKFQRTSQSGDQDWSKMSEWSLSWSHALSAAGQPVPNMVSLASGDINRDGVDDLAISKGRVIYAYPSSGFATYRSISVASQETSTAVALWGSKTGMLHRYSAIDLGQNHENLGPLTRVSFTYGDITGDGTPELIMTGQKTSDLTANKTRSLAIYIYEGDKGLSIDAAQTVYVVDGEYQTIKDGDGNDITTYVTNNGYDADYHSLPIMRTNSAVMKPQGDENAYIYLDSVMLQYMEGSFSIAFELDDGKYDANSGQISGGWINHGEGLRDSYCEYGAVTGDINGDGYDILALSFIADKKTTFGETNVEIYSEKTVRHGGLYLGGEGGELKTKRSSGMEAPAAISMPDIDFDTTLIEYSGIHYLTYSDPQVLAIIAAAPYFEDVDIISGYDYAGQNTTSYSRTKGSGESDIVAVDFEVGLYASGETTAGGAKWELETSLGFTLSWKKKPQGRPNTP